MPSARKTKPIWLTEDFKGGLSDGTISGYPGSYRRGSRIDARIDPDGVTIGKALAKDSSTTVTGLVLQMVPVDVAGVTHIYAVDDIGKVYRKTGSGAWSNIFTTSDAKGKGIGYYDDYVIVARDNKLDIWGPLSGSAIHTANWQTISAVSDMDRYKAIHMFKNFIDIICIANGRYLAIWDGTTFTAQRLTLPPGTIITGLAISDDRLVIGAVNALEEGYLYFWDGFGSTYNTVLEVPNGGVHALLPIAGGLLMLAGPEAAIHTWRGGSPLLRRVIPHLDDGKYLSLYPTSLAMHQNIARIGVAGDTDDTALELGLYGYGEKNMDYMPVVTMDHSVSSAGANTEIGSVLRVGPSLYVGWKDDSAAGIDKLSGTPADDAILETLDFFDGEGYTKRTHWKAIASHAPLRSGESIEIGIDYDKSGSFISLGTNSTVGSSLTEFKIRKTGSGAGAVKATFVQLQVTLAQSGGTAPTVYQHGIMFDADEVKV